MLGSIPAIKVSSTLIAISSSACHQASITRLVFTMPSEMLMNRALSGNDRIKVTSTPITPATNPIIMVSALNTRMISTFLAPTARSTPISLVRSTTDAYVIMLIMTDDTTSDIAANAISTYEIMSIISLIESVTTAAASSGKILYSDGLSALYLLR